MRNLFGFASFRNVPPADVGMEDYVFQPGLTFLPMSLPGPGTFTPPPLGLQPGSVLALNTSRDSGLPGILIPNFKTQPLSASNPAA